MMQFFCSIILLQYILQNIYIYFTTTLFSTTNKQTKPSLYISMSRTMNASIRPKVAPGAPQKNNNKISIENDAQPNNLNNNFTFFASAPGAPIKKIQRNIQNNNDKYFNSLDQGPRASPVKQKLVIHSHSRTPLAQSRAKKVSSGRPIKKAKGPETLCLIGKNVKCNLINDLNDC